MQSRSGLITNLEWALPIIRDVTGQEAKNVQIELKKLLQQLQGDPRLVDLGLYKKIFAGYQKNLEAPGYFTADDRGKVEVTLKRILAVIENDEKLRQLFSTPPEQLTFSFEQVEKIFKESIMDYMSAYPGHIAAFLKTLSQNEEAKKSFVHELLELMILKDDKTILRQIEISGILNVNFGNDYFEHKKKIVELFQAVKEKGLNHVDTVKIILTRTSHLIHQVPAWRELAKKSKEHSDLLVFESSLSDAGYKALRAADSDHRMIAVIGNVIISPPIDTVNFRDRLSLLKRLNGEWMGYKRSMGYSKVEPSIIMEVEAVINKVIAKKQLEFEKILDAIPNFKTEGKTAGVAFYQVQGGVLGRYEKQEDFFSIGAVPGFADLRAEQKDQVQKDAFAFMQKKHGREGQGSTAINLMLSPAGVGKVELKVANVGDSGVFIVRVKNGKVDCERLNSLHDLDNASEIARVKAIPGTQIDHRDKRLISGDRALAMTRAIGDNDINGVSHEPEITTRIVSFVPDERIFVITACDGLTEAAKMGGVSDEVYLKQKVEAVLQDKKAIEADSLPSDLAKQAMRDGSSDNLTVLGVELNPNSKETLSVGVYDGHSGKDVSSGLGKDFHPALCAATQLSIKSYHTKTEIDELLREMIDDKTDAQRKEALRFVREKIEGRVDEFEVRKRENLIQIMFIRTLETELSHMPAIKKLVADYYQAVNDNKSPQALQEICGNALKAANMSDVTRMPEWLRTTHIKGLSNEAFASALKEMQTAFRAKDRAMISAPGSAAPSGLYGKTAEKSKKTDKTPPPSPRK